MKVAFRAALAVTLLAGVYLLAAGIAVAMVSFGIWFMRVSLEVGVDRVTAAFFLMLALIGVFALLMGLFYRTPSATMEEPGIVLTEDGHPGLWSEVRSLSDTVGTHPPDEIRVVPEINAAVHDSSKLLGLVRGKRRLYVGAPLLIGFNRQQLRAVLAHELAHYSRRHTSLGGVTYRGQEALAAVVERFGRRSVIGRTFALYARFYDVVTFAVRRQQELEADDFSAAVAGPHAAASALAELPVLRAAWEHYGEEFLDPVHEVGKRPDDLFEGYAAILGSPTLQEALASFRTDFDEAPASRYSSHPPLTQRIARFRALPDNGGQLDTTSALALVEAPEQTLHELQEWMYSDVQFEPGSWTALLHGHQPRLTREQAQVLYRAAREIEHAEVSIGTLAASVRGRRLASYLRPIMEEPSAEHIQAASQELLHAAVDEALMSSSGATVSLDWDAAPRLVDRTGRTIDTLPVVKAAMDSGNPAVLIDWLAERDVQSCYVPVFPKPDRCSEAKLGPLRVLGVVAPIRGSGVRFLIVLTHGVLLRRARAGDWFAYLAGGSKPGPRQVARVVDLDPKELIRGEGDIWLTWAQIASASAAATRMRRLKITIVTVAGATYTVRYSMHTHDTGEALPAMAYFLEDRVEG